MTMNRDMYIGISYKVFLGPENMQYEFTTKHNCPYRKFLSLKGQYCFKETRVLKWLMSANLENLC